MADGDFAAFVDADGVRFDADDAALLRAVDEGGSVSAAAEALGRSRARALTRLDELADAHGPLVERRRGGADGGGSELTDAARALLSRFDRLRAGYDAIAGATETVLEGRVTARDGELGTIETPAGAVRAICPPGADHVQVGLRADAVTLQAPDAAPPDGATSARNRFAGTVLDVERGQTVVAVTVDVGGPEPLAALVTADSAARLDLGVGTSVVATTKATATRATPLPGDG